MVITMSNWMLTPPVDFIILLAVIGLLSWSAGFLSPRGKQTAGKGESYACGEDVQTGKIQPGYSEFFPFAFFFTIIHVVTLVLGTVPAGDVWLAMPFIAVSILSIIILLRRD